MRSGSAAGVRKGCEEVREGVKEEYHGVREGRHGMRESCGVAARKNGDHLMENWCSVEVV